MLDFNKTIQSQRVLLRPMQDSDFEEMWALARADKDLWYYFPVDLSNEAAFALWMQTALEDWKAQRSLPFTVVLADSQEIAGATRIHNLSARDSRVEIGWTWLGKAYHGTGINGHVKQLLFHFLFSETKTLRIEFKTDVLNLPARKAMEKVGLVEEGVLRSHTLMTNNRRRDTIFYSILKDEWERAQGAEG